MSLLISWCKYLYCSCEKCSPWEKLGNGTQGLSALFPTTALNPELISEHSGWFFKSSLRLSWSLHFSYPLFSLVIQAWNFLSHLPVIDVGLSVKGWWDDAAEGHDEVSITTLASDKRSDNRWVRLHADQEYVLQVSLQRVSLGFHKVECLVSILKCFTPDTSTRQHTLLLCD